MLQRAQLRVAAAATLCYCPFPYSIQFLPFAPLAQLDRATAF
jgi:hypothetical protein